MEELCKHVCFVLPVTPCQSPDATLLGMKSAGICRRWKAYKKLAALPTAVRTPTNPQELKLYFLLAFFVQRKAVHLRAEEFLS